MSQFPSGATGRRYAESLGAGRLRTPLDVLVPQVPPAAAVAFCLVAAAALSLIPLGICSLVMAAGETFAARRKEAADATLA